MRDHAAAVDECRIAEVCSGEPVDAISERLRSVSWDFNVRVVQHEVESVHPYPAKFIADLPGTFLNELPVRPGWLVMDPFCGSGTTLAEAQRRGHSSLGVDLNPIACLIARVKTGQLPVEIMSSVAQVAKATEARRHVEIPNIPNLSHWFKPTIQVSLSRLIAAINESPANHRDFLRLAASSIIVRVSNQDSDTRYAAVDKSVSAADVAPLFVRSCERLFYALSSRNYKLTPSSVIEGNLLSYDLERFHGKVGMIITSPPYPNAYEYWLYHKYRMWWLGLDPLAVKEDEIGARAHFFGGKKHTAETFVEQMQDAFTKFSQLVSAGGWACFVIGRSIIHGQIVDNAEIIERSGINNGFELVYRANRNVKQSRKSFNLSHANIKQESIIVMRRLS